MSVEENEIREQKYREEKYREEKLREQAQNAERIMRNETQERVDDFENPFERSKRYFKMDEINAKISREKEKADIEQDRDMHDAQTKEERGL